MVSILLWCLLGGFIGVRGQFVDGNANTTASAASSSEPSLSILPIDTLTISSSTSLSSTSRSSGSSVSATSTGASATSSNPLPSPSAPAGTSKAGLAWPNGDHVPVQSFIDASKPISWQVAYGLHLTDSRLYTWSAFPIPGSSIPFVPMLWGPNTTYSDAFTAQLAANFSSAVLLDPPTILHLNEANQQGQGLATPREAAESWKRFMQPLKVERGYRLGSPSITSAPAGKQWIRDWLEECQGCTPDFLALHWYDIDPVEFKRYMTDFWETFKLQFACQNFNNGSQASLSQISDFMKETTAFMDSVDWIERYSWFGAMYEMQGVNPLNQLLDPSGKDSQSGKLSALGQQYVGAGNEDRSGILPQSSVVRTQPVRSLVPVSSVFILAMLW